MKIRLLLRNEVGIECSARICFAVYALGVHAGGATI